MSSLLLQSGCRAFRWSGRGRSPVSPWMLLSPKRGGAPGGGVPGNRVGSPDEDQKRERHLGEHQVRSRGTQLLPSDAGDQRKGTNVMKLLLSNQPPSRQSTSCLHRRKKRVAGDVCLFAARAARCCWTAAREPSASCADTTGTPWTKPCPRSPPSSSPTSTPTTTR